MNPPLDEDRWTNDKCWLAWLGDRSSPNGAAGSRTFVRCVLSPSSPLSVLPPGIVNQAKRYEPARIWSVIPSGATLKEATAA